MSTPRATAVPASPSTISLPIEGMTCASCVGRVEAALSRVEGVGSVSVNLATERADIRPSGPVDRAALIQAVERVGYDVPAGTTELLVEGMTCASCVGRVERALLAVPGVSQASVNLATERATVRGVADAAALVAAIDCALVHSYRDLASAPELTNLLDVQVVSDRDMSKRSGYGALFSSVHHRPVMLWERQQGL